jgi:hypothetical protein
MNRLLSTLILFIVFSSSQTLQSQKPDTLFFSADTIYQLEEIEVSATRRSGDAILNNGAGHLKLNMDKLQSLPRFLGNVDLLRTLQLTPGIQTSGELNSGLYIRGGDSGHNQILFNGATIYNPMHLLGFFSIFNNEQLASTTLFKSYIPSQYGGRISGTIDIQSKSELVDHTSVCGNFGIIASQGALATPIGKKSSLFLSARGTYINLLLDLTHLNTESIQPRYGFQDYNLTYVSQLSTTDKLILNAYWGRDKLALKEYYYQVNGGMEWQNGTASLLWEKRFSNQQKMSHTLWHSYYNNQINATLVNSVIRFPSRILDFGYKGNYQLRIKHSYWTLGGEYTFHHVNPQSPEIENLFSLGANQPPAPMSLHEYALYAQTNFNLGSHWGTHLGVRFSGALQPASEKNRQISAGLEPRCSIDYEWKSNHKLSLSYNLQRQYMNQVVVSSIGLPTDFWLPTSSYVPAQYSHNLSLGYFKSFMENEYELSVEGYWKKMYNQMEFNGELFNMVNQQYHIEQHLYYGKGMSYGVEFMFKKNKGRMTGWISYTLGKSIRKFPEINDGQSFPAKNDRRHDLSIVTNYKLNPRWELSGVFVYATGSAFTMPTALYLIGENAINEYGPHNGARMPAYHRLDLSANFWIKRTSRRENVINFSLYNAYARANPIFLSIQVKPDKDAKTLHISPQGQSLYSLIPSISYSFKF